MRLYQRGATWWYDYKIGGERVRESTGTTDKREARAVAEEAYRRDLKEPRPAGYTLYSALSDWLKHAERSEGDKRAIAYLCRIYPDRATHLVTDKSLRDALGNKTAGTYNRYANIVRAAVNLAERDGSIKDAPKIARKTATQKRLRFLSSDEWGRLRAELPAHLLAMAEFTLATGLRQANVLGLEWSQVDMPRRVAWIHADQAKAGKVISVPLNDDAMTVLRRQIGLHQSHVFVYNGKPIKWINSGAVIDPETMERKPKGAWGKALVRAGIDGFRWHDLRHTWASWHVMAGTPLAVLKELGGWESVEMVQVYAHLSPDHVARYAGNVRPPVAQTVAQSA